MCVCIVFESRVIQLNREKLHIVQPRSEKRFKIRTFHILVKNNSAILLILYRLLFYPIGYSDKKTDIS